MKIFSGTSNKKLALAIGENSLNDVYLHTFPSGEKYCEYKENIRGENVYIIQSGSFPANDNLMELLVMADAAKRASAKSIIAVLPYGFYNRQDRKEKERVPISAKLVMNMLERAGVNRILTMDMHAAQISGFTDLPLDHLSFSSILANCIKNQYNNIVRDKEMVVVAPDNGGIKRGTELANKLGCDFAFINKKRINDSTVELKSFIGDVNGKIAIIVDDLTESCGTLIQAAQECKERGAKTIICAVTHFCITDIGMDRLVENMYHPNIKDRPVYINYFIHSNTVDTWWKLKYKPTNIIELSVSQLFAKAINRIESNKSVIELNYE